MVKPYDMKNLLLISALSIVVPSSVNSSKEVIPFDIVSKPVVINLINGKIDNREELVEAMAFVESGGNPATIGDINLGAPSVGLLQIRPIMVREVNRILKNQGLEKRFKNSDRRDGDKSIEMFNIWADAYHLSSSYEKMARNWNGGPRGYRKTATSHYWTKVTNYVKLNL